MQEIGLEMPKTVVGHRPLRQWPCGELPGPSSACCPYRGLPGGCCLCAAMASGSQCAGTEGVRPRMFPTATPAVGRRTLESSDPTSSPRGSAVRRSRERNEEVVTAVNAIAEGCGLEV